ncbi:YggT family protein [Burkholderiaceae bacterium DAT-1]|nr:YggT family protein [Burkholderiaceae bacterium DAT-1]
MFNQAVAFLINNIAAFFIFNLVLRFLLQVVRAPFHHPLAQFVLKLTNFIVLPLRKVVPSLGGYDTASLLAAWLIALVMNALLLALDNLPVAWGSPSVMLVLGGLALVELLRLSLYLLFGAMLVQAILSWVNPHNPLSPLLDRLVNPVLNPLRKLIPPMNGLDLTPLFALLAIEMLQRFVITSIVISLRTSLFVLG